MSLGIAFKGPDGIVLAADSRVTLMGQAGEQNLLFPAVYDNASKLLRFEGQRYVGAVTFGAGAIGITTPRTASSYLPEFEEELSREGTKRLGVEDFSKRLSSFFSRQWSAQMPKDYTGPPMVFLVGGYDIDEPYGRVFIFEIPGQPKPIEQTVNEFGLAWGGQREIADRILQGFDEGILGVLKSELGLPDAKLKSLRNKAKGTLSLPIPYQFLPLQDSVDLAIFLIRATIAMQAWMVALRGVGGAIDVATITRVKGFEYVQSKTVKGERELSSG